MYNSDCGGFGHNGTVPTTTIRGTPIRLKKLQCLGEPFDMIVLVPKRTNYDYVRFEADKLLFRCDLLSPAIFYVARFNVTHRRAVLPTDFFDPKSPFVLQKSQPWD